MIVRDRESVVVSVCAMGVPAWSQASTPDLKEVSVRKRLSHPEPKTDEPWRHSFQSVKSMWENKSDSEKVMTVGQEVLLV